MIWYLSDMRSTPTGYKRFPEALAPATRGFTLIELLLVIAVIGIMSSLVISAVVNAVQDSRGVIAKQQQVTLQEALNAWVASASSGTNTVGTARAIYATNNAAGRLALLEGYLHRQTYTNFSVTNTRIASAALSGGGSYLEFTTWGTNATNSYPIIEMGP